MKTLKWIFKKNIKKKCLHHSAFNLKCFFSKTQTHTHWYTLITSFTRASFVRILNYLMMNNNIILIMKFMTRKYFYEWNDDDDDKITPKQIMDTDDKTWHEMCAQRRQLNVLWMEIPINLLSFRCRNWRYFYRRERHNKNSLSSDKIYLFNFSLPHSIHSVLFFFLLPCQPAYS